MERGQLTCEGFLEFFIEKATVNFLDVKFSLGCLIDAVERNKHLERDIKEFFDILVVKDWNNKTLAIFPENKGIGYYCGDLRNRNERLLRRYVLDLFTEAIHNFSKHIPGDKQYKSFLESSGDWPYVKENERALGTAIKLRESYENGKDTFYSHYTCLEHAVDTLIVPVIIRKSLNLGHDNLLKHVNFEYMTKILQMLKWKSGLEEILESFDLTLEDVKDEDKKENLYKILL